MLRVITDEEKHIFRLVSSIFPEKSPIVPTWIRGAKLFLQRVDLIAASRNRDGR